MSKNGETNSLSRTCPVCSFIIGWNDESKTADIVAAFFDSSSEKNAETEFRCSICLGILEFGLSRKAIGETIDKYRRADFDVDSFNLAITTPPSCLIREKLVRLFSSKNKKNDDRDQQSFVLTLKDACRLCYQAAIEKELSNDRIRFDAQSEFTISITFENSRADECCSFLRQCFPDRFSSLGSNKKRKRWHKLKTRDGNNAEWSRSAIADILPLLTSKMADECDFRSVVDECSFLINLTRTPLFIGGRYCKYSRNLSQTPWVVDGVRRGHTSVQELICEQLTTAVGTDDVKFTSSGREDTDVRMLGDGRPFAIQFVNSRRKRTLDQSEIDLLQRRINESAKDVAVRRLRIVSAAEFTTLKLGEEHKKKTYVCLIWSPNSLSGENERKRIRELESLAPLELEQKTPIRVLHRRPLAVRRRTVENFRTIIMNDHYFQLRLTTQAGTYVKEFVHGDFGRTKPSLTDLLGGMPVDILELDVESIDLAWP